MGRNGSETGPPGRLYAVPLSFFFLYIVGPRSLVAVGTIPTAAAFLPSLSPQLVPGPGPEYRIWFKDVGGVASSRCNG